ncbi:MAG: hypothetical protein IPK68_02430 [Bdellovibrionales bacterium]|nr:hypothetical protein [Bdellovibrionales bacterium]
MKKILQLSILTICLIEYNITLGLAESSSVDFCSQLESLLNTNEPSYLDLERLKSACKKQMLNSDDARLLSLVQNLDIKKSIELSHQKRIVTQRKLLERLMAIENNLKAISSQNKASEQSDEFYQNMNADLNVLASDINVFITKGIEEYFEGNLLVIYTAFIGDKVSEKLNPKSISLTKRIAAKIEIYKKLTHSQFDNVGRMMSSRATKAISRLQQLRSQAAYETSKDVDVATRRQIAEVTTELMAISKWEQFIIGSKLDNIQLLAQLNYHQGFVSTTEEYLNFSSLLIQRFLSGLPESFSKMVKIRFAVEYQNKIEALRKKARSLSYEDIDSRQKGTIISRWNSIQEVKHACIERSPSISSKIAQIESDFKFFNARDMGGQRLSKDLIGLMRESLARRLDIALALCRSVR